MPSAFAGEPDVRAETTSMSATWPSSTWIFSPVSRQLPLAHSARVST